MKNRKEQILEKALELFLKRGYSGVSISILQEELGIGRATMYYYFKDKEQLFRTIVERYYIEPLQSSVAGQDDILLSGLIEMRQKMHRESTSFFEAYHNAQITAYNLQSILFLATIKFPDLGHTIGELKKQETRLWKRAIKNSVDRGEIKPDIDVENLALAFSGLKEMSEFSVFVKVEYGDRYIGAMSYLYDLVRL
ncbi:MAG: TetR/AcrR family transcriptional regulator [Paludibacteraceae bacterium]|nr:TetR/AcrR family transcriptional regulator [Paludibacteraceae bacterium]